MSVNVRIKLNEAAFRRMNEPGGVIGRGVQRAAGVARDQAKVIITQEGRVDTGAMRQNVRSEQVRSDSRGVFWRIIADLPYSRFQHDGIGPVVPRRARVLRFKPKGGGAVIFRPRTAGFPGIRFLTRALERLSTRDFFGG